MPTDTYDTGPSLFEELVAGLAAVDDSPDSGTGDGTSVERDEQRLP
jgi:hypothetical protein